MTEQFYDFDSLKEDQLDILSLLVNTNLNGVLLSELKTMLTKSQRSTDRLTENINELEAKKLISVQHLDNNKRIVMEVETRRSFLHEFYGFTSTQSDSILSAIESQVES